MDFAGHGWSDHRPLGMPYSGLSDLHDILSVADQMEWETFSIIGHSMGAELGAQLAGLYPDRVTALVCLDGFCGTDGAPQTLAHLSAWSGLLTLDFQRSKYSSRSMQWSADYQRQRGKALNPRGSLSNAAIRW